jgi:xanthine dehydrogenase YagS FAD-binding subunit
MINAFAYRSPKTVEAAVASLGRSWGETEVLAGGTDLLDLLKEGLAKPQTVVNIKEIADLHGIAVVSATGQPSGNGAAAVESEQVVYESRGIRRLLSRVFGRRNSCAGDEVVLFASNGHESAAAGSEIRIGATVTLEEIATHSAIRRHLPALADAAAIIGGAQIRNMGTLGGNLCQRNRCWYFRNGFAPEVKEENQYSAIFPMQGATYVHPSTLAPPLIAYGALAEVAGPNGRRKVPVDKLFQVADAADKRETVLSANEIITAVFVPVAETKSADYQVRERQSHDWPLVQASVALSVDAGRVAKASIVLGHVAPVPLRSRDAEQAIAGKELTDSTAAQAGSAAAGGAKSQGQNGYKITLVQVAVKRALLAAIGNTYWRS